jgi:hypothetical protein
MKLETAMKLPIVDENSIPALDLPGRHLRWVVNKETTGANHCSMCVIEVQPGQTVKPAHSPSEWRRGDLSLEWIGESLH